MWVFDHMGNIYWVKREKSVETKKIKIKDEEQYRQTVWLVGVGGGIACKCSKRKMTHSNRHQELFLASEISEAVESSLKK